MGRILLTRQAEEDLLEIWSYVADDNPAADDDLLDDIDATCAKLADATHSGRLREELAPTIRSMPVGNYVIFYRPEEDGVVVIRVLHGARDLPGLL